MKRRVALIIETSSIYGRGLLAGVVRYMRMHDEWSVYLEQRDLTRDPPAWLSTWNGDGILSRVTTPQLLKAVADTGVPFVELTDRHQESSAICVRSDDHAIGEMAAKHLLERGFRHFGYCGFFHEAWSNRREQAFVNTLRQHRCKCDVLNSVWQGPDAKSWEEEQQRITRWLNSLNRPSGIMACNDIRGQSIVDACSKAGFAVPEEVAIIGVDNDELLCKICDPPLSSVMANAEGVGYRGAELLSLVMNGKTPDQNLYLVKPVGIVTRQSTDVIAIEDGDVVAALQYIRQYACHGIGVEDLVRDVKISRSTLERKLRKYIGRTPQQEIRHIQVKRVCELLASTDLSAEEISSLCGFAHPEYLYVVFRRTMGMTPGEYRQSTSTRL